MIELDLRYTQVNALPASFGCQSKLEILHLGNCCIESFPSCFKNLIGLKYLDIRHSQKLQTLPELPRSLEILLAQECTSLEAVSFPSFAEQFKENRKRVVFTNCLKLNEHSLANIGLNAQVNIMQFAYKHVSSSEHDFHTKFNKDHNDSHQALYVNPGSSVLAWFEHKTTTDYVVIDLSSSTSRSPLLGFIFCFVLGGNRLIVDKLKFNITICDVEGEGKDEDRFELYVSRPSSSILSDHIFMIYDQQCSCYLNNKAKDMSRFKIKVTTRLSSLHPRSYSDICMVLKGFGVNIIGTSSYHNFINISSDIEM
ncbi:disease resistance protein RPV1 [Trifolium repens]|nr:disease resistance protein RPV1 [Trifolium repens]